MRPLDAMIMHTATIVFRDDSPQGIRTGNSYVCVCVCVPVYILAIHQQMNT